MEQTLNYQEAQRRFQTVSAMHVVFLLQYISFNLTLKQLNYRPNLNRLSLISPNYQLNAPKVCRTQNMSPSKCDSFNEINLNKVTDRQSKADLSYDRI